MPPQRGVLAHRNHRTLTARCGRSKPPPAAAIAGGEHMTAVARRRPTGAVLEVLPTGGEIAASAATAGTLLRSSCTTKVDDDEGRQVLLGRGVDSSPGKHHDWKHGKVGDRPTGNLPVSGRAPCSSGTPAAPSWLPTKGVPAGRLHGGPPPRAADSITCCPWRPPSTGRPPGSVRGSRLPLGWRRVPCGSPIARHPTSCPPSRCGAPHRRPALRRGARTRYECICHHLAPVDATLPPRLAVTGRSGAWNGRTG